ATELLGWTDSDAVGRTVGSLIIPERDRDAHWTGLKHFRVTGDGPVINRATQLSALTKSGHEGPVELFVTLLRSDDAVRFVGSLRRRDQGAVGGGLAAAKEASAVLTSDGTRPGERGSLSAITRRCLQLSCAATGWPLAQALMVREDGTRLKSTGVWHVTAATAEERSAIETDALQRVFKRGEDLPGRCWELGRPVWARSAQDFPRLSEVTWRGQRALAGLAVPIIVDGEVAAVIELYSFLPSSSDEDIPETVMRASSELQVYLERRKWRRERAFLAAIVESSPDAVIGKDRQGRILSWNQGAERMYGYTEEEAIGETIAIILPEGVDQEEQGIRDVAESGGRLSSFETKRRSRTGDILDVSLTISPIRDGDGNLIGSATIERDITPMKAAIRDLHDREEKLRLLMEASGEAIYGVDTENRCTFANRDGTSFPVEYWSSPIRRGDEIVGSVVVFEDATERIQAERTRAELAAIVESSGDAIIGKALDGTISSWNKAASDLYGYTAEEALGQPYVEIVGPDHEGVTGSDMTGLQQSITFEVVRHDRTGRQLHVGITVSPILDAYGQLIGTASIERDISPRKRREEELERARQEAEVANRAKSEVLANISHELRTPMNGVLGMLRITLEEELPPALADYLTTARVSAETLLALLDDLLDFSRMEAGQLELESEPFHVRDTVDAGMKSLALRAHERGLELGVLIESDVPEWLDGDGHRLRQVITNLAGNAIKFTDEGEVVVTIRCKEVRDDAITLECIVRDTGIGIPEDHLTSIFEPFTQVDASSTRARAGTGLGLAICKELVEKLGGSITVESEVGVGTTFRFTAEFGTVDVPARSSWARPFEATRILVVDDNATNRQILTSLLREWSIDVETAGSAREALTLLEQRSGHNPLSLVMIDMDMPEINGLELSRKIRQRDLAYPIVLMVSPKDRLAVERGMTGLGIATVLQKPVARSNVLDAVMTALVGPPDRPQPAPKLSSHPETSLDILVVEDTPANQKVVTAILERRGHHVTLAQNGAEALNALEERSFDTVLMDVQMPVMDGLQATDAIRNSMGLVDLPVIAMTAHAHRKDRRRCRAAGMNGFVSKPIDASQLIELVERLARDGGGVVGDNDSAAVLDAVDPNESPVDLDIALSRMGGDVDILQLLKEQFVKDGPRLLADAEVANEEGNFDALRRAAHSLKGLAANFEAAELVQCAMRIEDSAKARTTVKPEFVDRTRAALRRVIELLSE
ncbi:Hybrid signal transduction histidine kinase J, partial [Durusdinium trenchii]